MLLDIAFLAHLQHGVVLPLSELLCDGLVSLSPAYCLGLGAVYLSYVAAVLGPELAAAGTTTSLVVLSHDHAPGSCLQGSSDCITADLILHLMVKAIFTWQEFSMSAVLFLVCSSLLEVLSFCACSSKDLAL